MAEQSKVEDAFAATAFGKAALRKLAPLPEGFRLFKAEWVGEKPANWNEMRLTGCVFARDHGDQGSGDLIPIPGTERSVLVSKDDAES